MSWDDTDNNDPELTERQVSKRFIIFDRVKTLTKERDFWKQQTGALENDLIRLSHASPSMVLKECHEIIARIKRIAEDALAAHRKAKEEFGSAKD